MSMFPGTPSALNLCNLEVALISIPPLADLALMICQVALETHQE